jgi:hypothetical protein
MTAVIVLSTTTAFAGGLNIKTDIGPFHVDTSKPLHPVTADPVKVAPGVTVTPPVPGPIPSTPSVHVEGNGPVPALINKSDAIAHAPERGAQKAVDDAGTTFAKTAHDAGEAIAKPFRDLGDWFRGLVNQARDAAEAFAKGAFFWLMIGLFGTIAISVLISSIVTSLILRRSLRPRRPLRPRRV